MHSICGLFGKLFSRRESVDTGAARPRRLGAPLEDTGFENWPLDNKDETLDPVAEGITKCTREREDQTRRTGPGVIDFQPFINVVQDSTKTPMHINMRRRMGHPKQSRLVGVCAGPKS